MSWARLDDAMPESRKIADLSDAAFRAYVRSICYGARNLTDGYVPERLAHEMAGKAIRELAPALWHPLPALCPNCVALTTKAAAEIPAAGFYVHDYLEYNPPKTQVLAERAAAQRRMFALRSGEQHTNNAGSSLAPVPVPVPVPVPLPGIPIPIPSREPLARPAAARRGALTEPYVLELCEEFPTVDVRREVAKFRDYFKAKGKTHRDETAAFRNWLRREQVWMAEHAPAQVSEPGSVREMMLARYAAAEQGGKK